MKLPYNQITRFHWQDNVVDTLALPPPGYRLLIFALNTLNLLRNVKTCRLDFHAETIAQARVVQSLQSFIEGRVTVTSNHLTELELHGIKVQTGMHTILPHIKAPSLKKLTIFSSGPDHTALSTFFIHPMKLTSLTIQKVEMTVDEFSAVLTPLVSLEEISFCVAQVGGISDECLSLFLRKNPSDNGFSVIPRLERLSFLPVGEFASTYTPEALIDVLEARWRVSTEPDASDSVTTPTSRLLSIKLDKGVDDERLDQLRVEGLQVGVWGESDE
ncbi:hypothetical protein PM082_014534 [Marasmius tenuissimus]|nr:hypothetical protein PM082_014534 [Marasmius tenuissimus]